MDRRHPHPQRRPGAGTPPRWRERREQQRQRRREQQQQRFQWWKHGQRAPWEDAVEAAEAAEGAAEAAEGRRTQACRRRCLFPHARRRLALAAATRRAAERVAGCSHRPPRRGSLAHVAAGQQPRCPRGGLPAPPCVWLETSHAACVWLEARARWHDADLLTARCVGGRARLLLLGRLTARGRRRGRRRRPELCLATHPALVGVDAAVARRRRLIRRLL